LLVLQTADFILQSEFPALELGDFGVGGSRMVHCLRQLRLEGLVLRVQFTKMRLKTHYDPPLLRYDEIIVPQTWGLVEPLPTALVKNDTTKSDENLGAGGMPKLDMIQELQLRTQLQNFIQQHRDLDTAITSLEDTGSSDQLQLRRLKKMKLDLKDKIQTIENMLIPDIIA
jgi:hypothetical protein